MIGVPICSSELANSLSKYGAGGACLLAVSGGGAPPAAITIALREPPPLREPMDLVPADAPDTLAAKIGNVLIAEAEPSPARPARSRERPRRAANVTTGA
jgi:hypothetical protein